MYWRQELLLLHMWVQPGLAEFDQWGTFPHTYVIVPHWWFSISLSPSPCKNPQKRPRRKRLIHLLYQLENPKFCLRGKRKVKDISQDFRFCEEKDMSILFSALGPGAGTLADKNKYPGNAMRGHPEVMCLLVRNPELGYLHSFTGDPARAPSGHSGEL